MLNTSTLPLHVPLPPEYDRMPDQARASDIARLALLATHGGIYIDADVLVAAPLIKVVELLEKHEHITYLSPGQSCRAGVFSSNFIASQPNTTLWRLAWLRLQQQLRRSCTGRRPQTKEICCYTHAHAPLSPCHTPWALTDLIVHPVATELAHKEGLSMHCLDDTLSLTPMCFASPAHFSGTEAACINYLHIHTAPLGHTPLASSWPRQRLQKRGDGWNCGECFHTLPRRRRGGERKPNATIMCFRRKGDHLECRNQRNKRARAEHYFSRLAYHLFGSVNGATFAKFDQIESSPLAVAALYRRALSLPSR